MKTHVGSFHSPAADLVTPLVTPVSTEARGCHGCLEGHWDTRGRRYVKYVFPVQFMSPGDAREDHSTPAFVGTLALRLAE